MGAQTTPKPTLPPPRRPVHRLRAARVEIEWAFQRPDEPTPATDAIISGSIEGVVSTPREPTQHPATIVEDDVLVRWAWKTGAEPAITDEPEPVLPRSPVRYVLAGALAAASIVTLIAIGLGGAEPAARVEEVATTPAVVQVVAPEQVEPPAPAPVTDAGPMIVVATAHAADRSSAPRRRADADASYRTGIKQLARGNTAGALAALRDALAANRRHSPAWRALGLVHEKRGETGPARAAYRKYLELAPQAGDRGQIRERLAGLGT